MSVAFSKYGYVFSIDFGNTYTGGCYAITGGLTDAELRGRDTFELTENRNLHPVDINIVYHIGPRSINLNKSKIPTVVIYDQFRQLSEWGYSATEKIKSKQLGPYDKVFEKFKFKLPKSINQKGQLRKSESTGDLSEYDNLRTTIDYFSIIYKYMKDFVENSRFSNDYTIGHIRFVITVPAMWSNVERDVMRQIAIQAELVTKEDHENRLIIINESLAATLFVEHELAGNTLFVGDKYIICDAGGGTVNIATFIKTETQIENISFGRCQLTVDNDDKCGSTFLDLNMRTLLSSVLYGKDIFSDDDKQKNILNATQEDIKEIQDKLKVEAILEKFIGMGDNSKLKNSLGDNMKPEISDEEYFQQDREDFEKLKTHAIVFKEFDEIKEIDDNFDFKDSSEFKYSHEDEDNDITYYVNKDGIYFSSEYELIIPFEVMVKLIYGPIVQKTLELIERQVKKVDNYVTSIYLVGGLGRSRYLERRINQAFKDRVGKVKRAPNGEEAAMRGAAYYGVDGSKRPTQTDFNNVDYNENFYAEYYDTVICIDIGYDYTSCSYLNLNHEDLGELTTKDVKEWPGLDNNNAIRIPTAFNKNNNTWGATALNISDVDHNKLIIPNRFMSVVKDNLRRFLANFLRRVHNHILYYIEKEEGKTDVSKFRYCITMENSYKYFNKKEEMRRIAIEANIVPSDHDPERLLLIKREDAAAMYFEDQQPDNKKFSTYFLQVFFRHDSCHLSLVEAVKISGYTNLLNKFDYEATKYFKNIREVRSISLEFNFIAKLVANLYMYISKYSDCPNNHNDCSELREGLLNFVKEQIHFDESGDDLKIPIKISSCCVISISMLDLLEHIFRPAFRDLISKISRHFIQAGMNKFKLEKVFLVDRLFEAGESYNFFEKIFIKMLAETMDLESTIIQPPDAISQAAIKGAMIYGKYPESYTERVARKTYFVMVEAFEIQEFDDKIKTQISQEPDLDKQYDIEAKNAFRDSSKPIQLYYEPVQNPSHSYPVTPYYKNMLIKRGTKITEADETNNIEKTFYAEKECIVYVSLYTTEQDEIVYPDYGAGMDENSLPDPKVFQKIHQFEIYIKEDQNDALNKIGTPRHYFEICMILDNNEVRFEASVSSRLNENIPEFRFRDEFLVANIYDDSQEVKLKKTSYMTTDL